MRPVLPHASLAVLLAAAAPAAAQEARLAVEPIAAWRGATDLYRYDVSTPFAAGVGPGGVRSTERLRLTGAAGFGARLTVRPSRGWALFGEATRWRMRHEFTTAETTYDTPLVSWDSTAAAGPASAVALGLGVGRTVWSGRGTTVTAELVGSYVQARLEKPSWAPASLPPSAGVAVSPPWSPRYERVASRYAVPSLAPAVGVTRAVGGRLALRSRASYAVGRVDTRGFRTGRAGGWESLAEPRRWLARTPDLRVGAELRIR